MAVKLSRRLEAIAGLVTRGNVLADIGTDHAFLPIWLCAAGIVPRAVASDVKEGPLSIAAANIEEAGLSDRIEVRQSDGFAAYAPGEVKSAVVAGMGGQLICRILREGREIIGALNELILAPQSDAGMVRQVAVALGFVISQEQMVCEDGKYYPVIRLTPGMQMVYNRQEILFGPHLINRRDEVLHSYLLQQEQVEREILSEMKSAGIGPDDGRYREAERDLMEILQALRYYA